MSKIAHGDGGGIGIARRLRLSSAGFRRQIAPRRPWFGAVSRQTLGPDLRAGLTNAAIVLPQGVAFAIIAGLPPEFGLYTAMVVAAISAWWGASMVMVSGPTTAISAVLFATLAAHAVPGSAEYVSLAILLTFLVGVLQIIAGAIKLGGTIAFISHSVITGFTAAAALLIAASQLGGVLGIQTERGGGVAERILRVGEHIAQVNGAAVIISAVTLAALVVTLRIDRRLPAYIVALAAGALAGIALGAEDRGVAMFQPLNSVMPSLALPDFSLSLIADLLPGALTVAFVGLLEAISIGKAFAMRRDDAYDSNQEIVGQGMGNLIGSFFQCYAGSGSFTRSGLNVECGARTPVAAISSSVFLLGLLFLLAPFVSLVPVPAMAAIILYVAWRLINFAEIGHIIRHSRRDTVVLALTFLTGTLTELDFAVLVGVLTSLAVFLHNQANPVVSVGTVTDVDGRHVFMNALNYNLPQCPQIVFMRIDGSLFFGSVEQVAAEFARFEEAEGRHRTRILNIRSVGRMDLSGADFLIKEVRRARMQGVDIYILAANREIVGLLRRYGVLRELGEGRLMVHKGEAIASAVRDADDRVCATCKLRLFSECAGKAGAV